jgi:hypothetical protein
MMSYEVRYTTEVFHEALRWEEGRRHTGHVRKLVEERIQNSQQVQCIWTSRRLNDRNYDIDHCFPWSRWSNNDLWNLLPATATANSRKAEKLPAASLLQSSRERMLEWWHDAFLGTERENQFFTEVEAALPIAGVARDLDMIFEGVAHQRMRLKMNQQLAEWYGLE